MKLKYLVSFGIMSLVAIVAVFFSIQVEDQVFNRDFKIETLKGDSSILDRLAISAIIREGNDKFTKVTFTSKEPEFTPTVFDVNHWVGEEVLANRELFRGAIWAQVFETDEFKLTHVLDSEYIWKSSVKPTVRLGRLDKVTGNIEVVNRTFTEFDHRTQIWGDEYLVQANGTLYYVLASENQEFFVYSLNPDSLTLNFEFKGESNIGNRDSWLSWAVVEGGLFVRDTHEDNAIYRLNFETQQLELTDLDVSLNLWSLLSRGDQFIFETREEGEGMPQLHVLNKKTNDEVVVVPSFLEEAFDPEKDWMSSHSIVDRYLIINYTVSSYNYMTGASGVATQFIGIYDLDTMEMVYEGSIRLRHDQGLLESWGGVDRFQVTTRN